MFTFLDRSRFPLFSWLLALCLATFFTPAWALKRVALVIGNSEYVVESRLANPVNDAQLMARTLKAQGFTVDVKTDLPKRAMELAIATFIRQSAGADSAVLYYAGHGSQPANGGRNFLLPVDARVEGDDTLETDGIAADRIVEQMERSANPAKLRLVVLDACRNNRLGGKTRSGIRGLARMSPSDDYTLIAFSTNDQNVAQDGSGANSPYAKALSQHLGQASELPLRRIFELTATDVRAATGQKQKPRTYGDLDSRILLDGTLMASIKPEPVTQYAGPSAVQIESQAWEAAQRVNSVAGYNAYLGEYPNGSYASAAQVARAGLEPTPRPAEPVPPVRQTPPTADKGTADEAMAMVKKGVAFVKANGKENAFAEFNNPKGQFIDRDLYVMVYDMEGNNKAHGFNPKLVGRNLLEIKDADGKFIVKGLIEMAPKGKGWFDYKWPNSVTKVVGLKSIYVEKLDDVLIGVTIYK